MAKPSAFAPASLQVAPPPGPAFDDWNLLRAFLAVYETGTLTAAAERLQTTQPSMGRQLRALEAQTGEPLFKRLPGRLQATARADALFETLVPMRHAMREAQTLFAQPPAGGGPLQVQGVVRLAVSEVYGARVVPALLAPLLWAQPELEIELAVSNRADNLLRRDADIAVRFFRPDQPGLIARKLGHTELGLYAHVDYLARQGGLPDWDRAGDALLTGFDRERWPLADYISGPAPQQPLRFRFRSDAALARLALVEAGAAVGMTLADVAARNLKLRRVHADRVGQRLEVWLCAHDELRRSARMRYVWEGLGDALTAWLAGMETTVRPANPAPTATEPPSP